MKKLTKNIIKQMKNYPLFYQKVWIECAKIPYGQTRTYKWLAQKIGSPRAARAVGQALKKNPFAPIIPCHRVIKADGTIGGYSAKGGILKKKELLRKEKRT